MIKSELRKLFLDKLKALSPEERKLKSDQIADAFFSSFDLDHINYLHAFISIEKFNEVDTRGVFEKIWREHTNIKTVVPRVDKTSNEIRNPIYGPDTQLARSSWGIDEPAHDEFVEAAEIDMVLVPGLCFDRHGHRVGYGKGYYDRFLAQCRSDCVKIGLNFFELVDSIDDIHDGDVAVEFVINPTGVRTGSGSNRVSL
jgi:5-formyltetrahydrofolate cyclo-ligase